VPKGLEVQVLSRALMKLIDRTYVESNKEEIIEAIKSGKIFIYPTDTIYGLGCNAYIEDAVDKVRTIKKRDDRPISVMSPSKVWIEENCEAKKEDLDKYLPGPYTLIFNRSSNLVAQSVNSKDNTLGVRIPDHWFSGIVSEAGVPFVTTSVNLSGEKHMEKLEDVSEEVLNQVDYVVYEGEKRGKRSEKVVLTKLG